MGSPINKVEFSGTVMAKEKDYWVVSSKLKNGKENIVHIWNLPNDTVVGSKVTVVGKIKAKKTNLISLRPVVGIEACKIVNKDGHRNYTAFSGILVNKGEMRHFKDERRAIYLTVKVDPKTYISIIAWDDFADNVDKKFRIGDSVFVSGVLFTRECEKISDGEKVSKTVSEVNAYSVRKIA